MTAHKKQPAWSYSALTSYENCPHRFYRTRIAKDISDPPGEAAQWGTRLHKLLEERVRDKKPLPESVAGYEDLVKRFDTAPGQVIVEHQICLNRDMRLTSWFGKDAWCRGVIDVGVVAGRKATLLDYKTGSRKPENEQLKLFAGLGFIAYPHVETISTGFIWLKEKKMDKEVFHREQAPEIWQSFAPRVQRFERAHETGQFEKKPSGLCNGWCPVKDCEFWKPRR